MLNLKDIQIEIKASEAQRILSINLDENPQDALAFIREVLCKRVEKALQSH